MDVTITYVGMYDEVEFAQGDLVVPCKRGESVTVPDFLADGSPLAGRPPSGTPGEDGYDPGVGLLAQPANWQPAADVPTSPAEPAAPADVPAGAEPAAEPTTTDTAPDAGQPEGAPQ